MTEQFNPDGVISAQDMQALTITAASVQPSAFVFPASNGRPLVTIRPDGTLEFGDDYQPDEAALLFWEAVQRLAPTPMEQYFGKPLAARIDVELDALQHVRAWVSNEPVVRNDFGNGYREALRDVAKLLPKED